MKIEFDKLLSLRELSHDKEGLKTQSHVDHSDSPILSRISQSNLLPASRAKRRARQQVRLSRMADYVHRGALGEVQGQKLSRHSPTLNSVLGVDCRRLELTAHLGVATTCPLKKNLPFTSKT